MAPNTATDMLHVGTSGWSYPSWKNTFYAGVKRDNWLAQYATHFSAVEVNASFYRLLERRTYRKWYQATPAHFCFALKANRYLTAYRRLQTPEASIEIERERATALKEKLGIILWQFPESFHANFERLEGFAHALKDWRDVRHALEFRHNSWFRQRTWRCLHEHGLANVQSDSRDWPMWDAVTTDVVYVRLHGHTRTYVSSYSSASLRRWADKVQSWRADGHVVHVYFDNTESSAALGDAERFLQLLPPIG